MILELNGARFQLKKRKANKGEMVLLNRDPLRVATVKTVYGYTIVDTDGKENFHQDYIVLEKLEA